MRKHVSKQIKPEKAIFSLKKILIIALIFIVLMGTMGVMATNEKVKTVKILLSSGYEMNVVTTSTKVSDILSENHVIVLDGETLYFIASAISHSLVLTIFPVLSITALIPVFALRTTQRLVSIALNFA